MKAAHDIKGLINLLKNSRPRNPVMKQQSTRGYGGLRAVESLITTLKKEEISGIQWKAAEALGKIGNPAVEPLISALWHSNEDVRWKAAISLGEIGDSLAIDPLIRFSLWMTTGLLKSRAALALGMIGKTCVWNC